MIGDEGGRESRLRRHAPAMRRVVKSGGIESRPDCSAFNSVSARHSGQLVTLIRPPIQDPYHASLSTSCTPHPRSGLNLILAARSAIDATLGSPHNLRTLTLETCPCSSIS
jgi:hypothetical protein